ncbi:MAG: glutamine amidotransferase, partial [Chloroflexi bacterium]|nr:glutamine amidotransferase [Chloroflexota bacterium]
MELKLRLAHLYPKLMNIYGDRGNILCLERRCRERGIGFEVTELGLGEKMKPKEHDLV